MTSKSVEDYLETIYNLIEEKGIARTGDISKALHVKPPSVTEMLNKLAKDELIIYKKYNGASLTSKGEKLAKSVNLRHKTLVDLLNFLGVDEDIVEEDACKIEHDLNPKTIKQLQKFLKSVE